MNPFAISCPGLPGSPPKRLVVPNEWEEFQDAVRIKFGIEDQQGIVICDADGTIIENLPEIRDADELVVNVSEELDVVAAEEVS